MGVSANDEIATIEKMKELKAGGAQVTNTVADLDASIAENEMAIVIASFAGVTGRQWVRGVVTGFVVVPAIVLAILWWVPPTTRAMTARRHRRTPAQHGPVLRTPYGSYR